MLKETIICIVIVIAIVTGNNITKGYTEDTVNLVTGGLEELKQNIEKDEIQEKLKEQIYKISGDWDERQKKLAYFIEHDELEKVETNITSLRSFIETQEYEEAVSELDKSVFVLKHIQDKYAFNLQNIF